MTDEQNGNEVLEDIKNAEAQIIAQLGFQDAPEEKKKEMLETLDRRVAVAITKIILEKASPEEAEMMRVALEDGGNIETKIADIVSQNPKLQSEIKTAMTDLWDKVLKESEAAKN